MKTFITNKQLISLKLVIFYFCIFIIFLYFYLNFLKMNIINNYCDTVTGNFILFCFSFFIKILCHFVVYFIIFSLFLFFVMILINNIIFTFIPLTVLLFYSLLSAGVVFLIFFIIDIVLNLGFNFEFFNLINTWIVSSYEYPSNFIIYEIDPKILNPLHEISENAIKNLIKG